ncbi:MAG: SseB family protein [Acidobacteriia bacterium]|nr:SseB family protein [Terriglobia bacterium]
MLESSTPLSDCISRYSEQGTRENYEQFLRVFLGSQLGVIVEGIPQGTSGQYVAGKNELTVAMSIAPDGKKTVLACADRAIFVQRFAQQFNAEVGAAALLKIAWSNPDCEGIMVNSAASEHRIVIPRKHIAELIATRT